MVCVGVLFIILLELIFAKESNSKPSALTTATTAAAAAALRQLPDKDGCDHTLHDHPDYDLIASKCPLQFFALRYSRQLFYTVDKEYSSLELATYYVKEYDVETLKCDTFCGSRTLNSTGTLVPLKGTSVNSSGSFSARDTVVRDVATLRHVFNTLTSTSAPSSGSASSSRQSDGLPWCGLQMGDDGEGHWVPRRLLPYVREGFPLAAFESGEHQEAEAFKQLSRVMSGDVAVPLTWPYVWVPSKCRTFWYNVSTILKCASKWREQTNTTLWIYFLGDSVIRSSFCGLLRLFTRGGACNGAVMPQPCFHNISIGGVVHSTRPSDMEFTFACAPINVRVSFHSTLDAKYPFFRPIVDGMMRFDRGRGVRGPSHVIHGSGNWDHYFRFSLKAKVPYSQVKRKGKTMILRPGDVRIIYTHSRDSPTNPVDHDRVNAERPGAVRSLLQMFRANGFSGTFIYRSNHCNHVFEARAADAGVEAVVQREFGGAVLSVYNASQCRGKELLRDEIHVDRRYALRPPVGRPSVGELNSLVTQSLLNGICNPLLFDATYGGRL